MTRLYAIVLMMVLAALGGLISAPASAATKVEEVSQSFQVVYPKGAVETVVVTYEAFVETLMQRNGRASTWKHPIDDRSCTWQTRGYVQRQAAFVSASGVRAPITETVKVFDTVKTDARGPRNIVQAAGGYHKTCGDVMGKINRDHADGVRAMQGAVRQVVADDASSIEATLKALLKPVRVASLREVPKQG